MNFPCLVAVTKLASVATTKGKSLNRTLYLVCYDISSPKRLQKALKLVKAYAISGQKSFYECMMTPYERTKLETDLTNLIDENTDRIHFFQLDPRQKARFFGVADRQSTTPFLII